MPRALCPLLFNFLKALPLLLVLVIPYSLISQTNTEYSSAVQFDPTPRNQDRVRVMFYNVENLFDYFDDSTTLDDEFTPLGGHHWTKKKYTDKLNKLAKTIIGIGGWEAPALIGLCEVENRYVLESLTKFTQLKPIGYEIVHQDSEDRRGIDVAVLYRPEKIKLLNYEFYSLRFPFNPESRTRDILHFIGQLPNLDTLHFFVNHWPSKFGGVFETEPKRLFAARYLRDKVDSLLNVNPSSKIIITGDFNDEPDAKSIVEGLGMSLDDQEISEHTLYNLMYNIRHLTGTHSFENRWSILDQFIVSGQLLNKSSPTSIYRGIAKIFDMEWLIMEGATGALRPFRTYQGPKYIGGYSDHLPIYLDLVLK